VDIAVMKMMRLQSVLFLAALALLAIFALQQPSGDAADGPHPHPRSLDAVNLAPPPRTKTAVKAGGLGGAVDLSLPQGPPFHRNAGAAIATVTFPRNLKMWVHNTTECIYISSILLEKGRWPGEDRMLEKALDVMAQIEGVADTKLFLDVGTNVGFYSFNMAVAGFRVASFEPLEYNAELVRASIKLNGLADKVTLFKTAVAAAPAPPMCVLPAKLHSGNQGNGMLVPAAQCDSAKHLTSREIVPVQRIDGLLAGSRLAGACIDVIKVDIEGYEADGLLGSVGAWETCKPCMIQFEFIREYASAGGRDSNAVFK
jgi:FkbM family methyltransferase